MNDATDLGLQSLIALAETNGRIRWLLNALIEGSITPEWARERLADIDNENALIQEQRKQIQYHA